MDGRQFRDLVSGKRQDWVAHVARPLLAALEVPYRSVVAGRNFAYSHDWLARHRAQVPVVSVGNLTLGGTGKTPLVAWIARWYRDQGHHPVILSRGYRAPRSAATLPDSSARYNDEAQELAARLGDVPHLQQRDRVAAAHRAVQQHQAGVLILDDGFQHQRLQRSLDIVLLDALDPWGYNHLFPRGMLREPLASLRRADVICLTRADAISAETCRQIQATAHRYGPHALWVESIHAPSFLLNPTGDTLPLNSLQGKRVGAFCGVGNPRGVQHTLQGLGCDLVAWREFPDHCAYDASTQSDLIHWVRQQPALDWVLCTHKDLVKFHSPYLGETPLWAVAIDCEFRAGQDELVTALQRIVARS